MVPHKLFVRFGLKENKDEGTHSLHLLGVYEREVFRDSVAPLEPGMVAIDIDNVLYNMPMNEPVIMAKEVFSNWNRNPSTTDETNKGSDFERVSEDTGKVPGDPGSTLSTETTTPTGS